MTHAAPEPLEGEVLPPNVFQVRTKNDLAALVYYLIPLAAVILVSYGILDNADAALYGGIVLQFAQLVFQFARTANWLRRAIYLVLTTANLVLTIFVAAYDPATLTNLMPLVAAVLGGAPAALASQNVLTSAPKE